MARDLFSELTYMSSVPTLTVEQWYFPRSDYLPDDVRQQVTVCSFKFKLTLQDLFCLYVLYVVEICVIN